MFDESLYEEAKMVATLAHQYQTYDIYPYEKHLQDVVNILKRFGFSGDYILAGWLHDTIEDCNISYNKIKKAFGENVAELVYAVTDPKARSRKDKKKMVYKDIIAYPHSIIIKLADRIANFGHSIRMDNRDKTTMYAKEHFEFSQMLRPHTPNIAEAKALWEHLDKMVEDLKSN